MINFHVLTLFPEIIFGGLCHSIIKRAIEKKIININCVNVRDFSNDKHKRVDDYIYGGGCGMLIKAQPVYDAYKNICDKIGYNHRVIYLTPQGKILNQRLAYLFAKEHDIILLCGHYEGIDQRVINKIVTDEISIGDYVLTGGELPAMVFIDCVSRLVSGVLNKKKSFEDDSFENNLLEYPQYTRPEIFIDKRVPEILLSGNHSKIKKWREKKSFINTAIKRPDLLFKSSQDKTKIINKKIKIKLEENKMNAIFSRRSIRKYKNQEITDEQLELLLSAGMCGPSAMNTQNWEFVIVKDKEHLEELSNCGQYYKKSLSNAALAIVVCGDTRGDMNSHYWIQNCSAAIQNILIQATEIELGTVWLGVAPFEEQMRNVSECVNLPEHIKPMGIISVGVPDEFKSPNDNFDENKVHYERF